MRRRTFLGLLGAFIAAPRSGLQALEPERCRIVRTLSSDGIWVVPEPQSVPPEFMRVVDVTDRTLTVRRGA